VTATSHSALARDIAATSVRETPAPVVAALRPSSLGLRRRKARSLELDDSMAGHTVDHCRPLALAARHTAMKSIDDCYNVEKRQATFGYLNPSFESDPVYAVSAANSPQRDCE
jgi:hypothetical protein